MTPDQWEVVAAWLADWTAAGPDRQEALRAQLAAEHPDLVAAAMALARSSGQLRDFLETTALALEAPALAATDAVLPAGADVGPYRVETLLARGGTGDVYRALDTRLHRPVALKVLAQARTSDVNRVERFAHEARVTASLDHPHVVRVYDVGQSDEHVYLVAELLEGETLRDRLARSALPVEDALRVALEIADGLAAAHAAGLIHRDLKPDNVFLTSAGSAKVLDFGIAKLLPDSAGHSGSLTMTGVILGTAGYLAPEQVLGASIDARADLFALGVLLFEMLTGERAFDREHLVDALHAILHDPPADALRVREGVPADLVRLVMQLLDKDPAARPQSAREVIEALQRIDSRGAPQSLPPPPVSRRTPAVVLAVGLTLVAGAWGSTWMRPSTPVASPGASRPAPSAEAEEKFRLGRASARRITPDDLRVAVRYFEEAIALAPDYADAWAGLASAYKRMPVAATDPASVIFGKARAAAEQALALDPVNTEALSALGTVAYWHDWDYARAETLLTRALALEPSHPDSHLYLAMLYDSQGRFAEALAEVRRAQAQDPQWAQLRALEGYFLNSARRYAEALRYLDTVIRDIDPAMWTTQMYRAEALLALGRGDEALAAFSRVLELTTHPMPVAMYAAALARMARPAEAEARLAELPLDYQYGRATALQALGRSDEAIAALRAAVDERQPAVTSLGIDAQWDGLRDRPDFRALVRRVNLLEVSDRFRR